MLHPSIPINTYIAITIRVTVIIVDSSTSLWLMKTEGFDDWGGRGYDDFVPGEVTKTAPSGDETT